MSRARTWSTTSTSPVTVLAAITSGYCSIAACMVAGLVLPWQNSSTNASVCQPSAAGSSRTV